VSDEGRSSPRRGHFSGREDTATEVAAPVRPVRVARPVAPGWREAIVTAGEAGTAGAAVPATVPPSLAALLTSHILNDGELVLLILKPSLWYVPLSSLRFIAATLIAAIAGVVWGAHWASQRVWVDVAAFLIAGRLMWATLSWMGRVYCLTDLRILRLRGVFAVDVYDCPLRKVARVRLLYTTKDRVVGVGSMEIIPADDDLKTALWGTLARPVEVQETVVAAINRAKHNGGFAPRN